METDDLPSSACPLRAIESRTVKRVPFSRVFFRIQDLPFLNVGIRDSKQNKGEIREYIGHGLPKKIITIAGFSEN